MCRFLMAAVTAAVVTSAAVVAASMTFAMMVVVMIAPDIGIEIQLSFQKSCYCSICAAGHTAIQLDTCCCQRSLCATADAAANQHICVQCCENTGQRAVPTSVGIHNLGSNNGIVLHLIDLKLFGVAEVLEDLSVFVSYCNSHLTVSFAFNCFMDFLN